MGKTKYDHNKIRRLYLCGWDFADIAKEVGCHINTVCNVLGRERSNPMTLEEIERAMELVRDKLTGHISRARHISNFCDWSIKEVISLMFTEYQRLREMRRHAIRKEGNGKRKRESVKENKGLPPFQVSGDT